jgi:putative membrane protein
MPHARWRRAAWIATIAYTVLTLISIGAFFAMVGRPMPATADATLWQAGYQFGMKYFGAGIIWCGFLAALCTLAAHVGGARALRAALAVCAITLVVELVGAETGFPFGEHGYGNELGWKVLGLIPHVIPLSWFHMLIASLGLAFRFRARPGVTLLIAALGLFAWDVLMEPGMSAAYPFWYWREGGLWYGMPLANWTSWMMIGPVIAYAAVRFSGPALQRLADDPLPAVLYATTGLLPFALALRFGLWPAAVVGGLAMAVFVAAAYVPARRAVTSRAAAGATACATTSAPQ